ncbi:MAG TPA: hypothetical protein PLJ78_12770 [Anaerolineae bacterium]|nr:hypothetical protein [Anaerolineae bacterium]HQK14803.1 hypothetical protein [Anaerolineae bacterium]
MPAALEYEIARLTGSFRRHTAIRGGSWGLVGALGGVLIAAIVARLMPLWHQAELLLASIWVLGGGILLGTLLGYAWPMPLPRRLRLFDRRLHLADRLTTAWELAQGRIGAPTVLIHLQHEETLQTVRQVEPRAAFPSHPPRSASIIALMLIAALIPALFLANPQEDVLARLEAQQQATEAAIVQLEQARAELADSPTLSEAEREAALKALDEALATLHNRQSTPEEQQAALSAAEQQLATLRSPEAATRLQRLAEASPLSSAEVVQPLSAALQQGDAEAAATYLRSLLDPTNKQPLTTEEMLALADAFAQIADALQATDPALAEQFQKAAQGIYTGDIASASEAIAQAAETLSEAAQANAPNQTLEQAQAGLQQAQEALGDAQRQTTGQAVAGTTTPSVASGTQGGQGTGAQGQPMGPGASQGTGGESGGVAVGGHHEDTGSSAPYGSEQMPRLTGQGGEITIPRQETTDAPHTTIGAPGEARVPYAEVYATYAEAARAAMARNAYPPALRAYVREYFEGLEP